MFNQKNVNLAKTVIDEYNQKAIVERYSELDGFKPAEEYLCKKYFIEKGRVLVVGCGAGRESIALAKNGFEVIGVDIAENMINAAKEKGKELGLPVSFLQVDAQYICFKESAFNYIVMFGSLLSYIPRRKNRIRALAESGQALAPNGILIVSFLKYSFFFSPIFYIYKNLTYFSNLFLNNFQRDVRFYNKIKCFKEETLTQYRYFKAVSINIIIATLFKLWIKMIRSFHKDYYSEIEDGDLLWVNEWFPGKMENRIYFHLYTYDEMLKDIDNAGYKILDCKYDGECDRRYNGINLIKEGSTFVYFVLQKRCGIKT